MQGVQLEWEGFQLQGEEFQLEAGVHLEWERLQIKGMGFQQEVSSNKRKKEFQNDVLKRQIRDVSSYIFHNPGYFSFFFLSISVEYPLPPPPPLMWVFFFRFCTSILASITSAIFTWFMECSISFPCATFSTQNAMVQFNIWRRL